MKQKHVPKIQNLVHVLKTCTFVVHEKSYKTPMSNTLTKEDDNVVMGSSSPLKLAEPCMSAFEEHKRINNLRSTHVNTIEKQTLMNKCFAFISTLKN